MIYEIRTYDLEPRSIPEFESRVAEKLPGRLEYSKLGGFWHTEVGPLNQVVHIWPYDDLNQRADVRARAVADGKWSPDNTEFIVNMQSEIFNPAPFGAAQHDPAGRAQDRPAVRDADLHLPRWAGARSARCTRCGPTLTHRGPFQRCWRPGAGVSPSGRSCPLWRGAGIRR